MSALSLSGCDELDELDKSDYITVTVICDVSVYATYAGDPLTLQPVIGATVNVEIIKDGGEIVKKTLITDSKGECESATATFNLYKEQSIVAIANIDLNSVELNYPGFVFNSASDTIPWSYIYPLSDFGDSTTEKIRLSITGENR